jgi:hypothetical protein
MALIRFLESTVGRIIRGAVGLAMIGVGVWLGGYGWVLAAAGLAPLGAAAADLCLIAPLFHAPLRPSTH